MNELHELLRVLNLEATGEHTFSAQNFDDAPGAVIFGGQIQAQIAVAGATVDPTKHLKSMHTIFARAGDRNQPLDIDVDVIHAGRSVASATVTVSQSGRIAARALCFLDGGDPDLIRHQSDAPTVDGPDLATRSDHGGDWWDIRTVGGVDINDPDAIGPAELFVWLRFPGAPADPATGCALLAYAADGFLIGTAMRPHQGVGQSLAHKSIATTVLTQTITFHEPIDASEWLLLAQDSPHAGNGRSYGMAHVFTEDGRLVASFTQENMIRDVPSA